MRTPHPRRSVVRTRITGPGSNGPARIDRSACPGRPGAHDPHRVGRPVAVSHYGCCCADALRAKRRADKRYRVRSHSVESTGTVRRLRALACLGYSPAAIVAGGPCTQQQAKDIRAGKVRRIRRVNADWIAAFYNAHQETELPHTSQTNQVRNTARRNGWAPPIAWDPDTLDNPQVGPQHRARDTHTPSVNEEWIELDQLIRGARLPLRAVDHRRLMRPAAAVLLARGLTTADIAIRLGCTTRAVERIKVKLAEKVAA